MGGLIQRAAPRVLLCGGLGVLTTVAVAWGLAAWVPQRGLKRRSNVISEASNSPGGTVKKAMPVYVATFEFSRTGMVRREWKSGYPAHSALWEELHPESEIALKVPVRQDRSWGRLPRVLAGDLSKAGSGGEDARGWPMLSMWCELEEALPSGMQTRGGIAVSAMAEATPGSARVLPLWPIWRGFAVDSGVFAVAWGVAIPMALFGRGVVRRRRGRCAACGYDRRGEFAVPCPECGARVAT